MMPRRGSSGWETAKQYARRQYCSRACWHAAHGFLGTSKTPSKTPFAWGAWLARQVREAWQQREWQEFMDGWLAARKELRDHTR